VLTGLGTVLGFVALEGSFASVPDLDSAAARARGCVAYVGLAATLGSASVLTLIEFPRHYFGGLLEFKALPVILVSVRDALLIAAIALVLRAVPPRGTGERRAADVKPRRPRWRSGGPVPDASPGRKLAP
jgi:hypothetical protein